MSILKYFAKKRIAAITLGFQNNEQAAEILLGMWSTTLPWPGYEATRQRIDLCRCQPPLDTEVVLPVKETTIVGIRETRLKLCTLPSFLLEVVDYDRVTCTVMARTPSQALLHATCARAGFCITSIWFKMYAVASVPVTN